MNRIITYAVAIGAWALAGTLHAAERDTAAFDMTNTVVLTGKVERVAWGAGELKLAVAVHSGKGEAPVWNIEGPPLSALQARGWNAESLKTGGQLSAVAYPARNGSRDAALVRIILQDGKTLETGSTASMVPKKTTTPSPDPMAGYYGNTAVCKGPTFECLA